MGQKLTAIPAFAAYNRAAVFALQLLRKPRSNRPVYLPVGMPHYKRNTSAYPAWSRSWLMPLPTPDQGVVWPSGNIGNMILSTTCPAYSTPRNPREGNRIPGHSWCTCSLPACGLPPVQGEEVSGVLLCLFPWALTSGQVGPKYPPCFMGAILGSIFPHRPGPARRSNHSKAIQGAALERDQGGRAGVAASSGVHTGYL